MSSSWDRGVPVGLPAHPSTYTLPRGACSELGDCIFFAEDACSLEQFQEHGALDTRGTLPYRLRESSHDMCDRDNVHRQLEMALRAAQYKLGKGNLEGADLQSEPPF